MTGTTRHQAWSAVLAGLLGTSMMVGLSSSQWHVGGPGHDGAPASGPRAPLDVTATQALALGGRLESPLTPGTTRAMDLTVSNPYDRTVVLTELMVTVTAVDAPEATTSRPCTVADYDTAPSRLDALTVAPRMTTSLQAAGVERHRWPTVSMIDTDQNQDGCRRASLALSLHAVGDFA